jgi:hypothetical protein
LFQSESQEKNRKGRSKRRAETGRVVEKTDRSEMFSDKKGPGTALA